MSNGGTDIPAQLWRQDLSTLSNLLDFSCGDADRAGADVPVAARAA